MPWNPTWQLDRRPPGPLPVVHELAGAVSRQRRLAVAAFAVVFTAVILFGLLFSDRYEARMEILVEEAQLRRADPVVTSDPDAQPIVSQEGMASDETLNSEIALLRSQNVLEEVVKKCGLDARPGLWDGMMEGIWKTADAWHVAGALRPVAYLLPFLRRPTQQEITAKAMRRLADKLSIEVVKMSDVISVAYHSNDPQLAARVLNTLGDVYLTEHALAHHPPGELQFFRKETDQARAAMDAAENKLTGFTASSGVASGQIQLDNALRRLSDEKASLNETRAAMAGTDYRIRSLRMQEAQIPRRQTTQLKTSDSDILLQNLKSSLLSLEMKRTGLLTEYQPNYPLVTEVDRQIAQARAALADAQKSQLQEKTTDRDPDYEMVREDLTRSTAQMATLRASAAALTAQIDDGQAAVDKLQQESMAQQDLMRNAQAAQDNYLLLLHKQEEARISEELDKQRIFNVSVVQPASVPVLPVHSALWYLMYGGLLSLLCGFATAVGADKLDPTLRTRDEAESLLRAPVLAVLPLPVKALPQPTLSDRKREPRVSRRSFAGR
ncbi:MAG TPA: Wzz/FepE/Etk N-terminal domain-containing protein [Terracidiphilus sp.]|nr:Wzz/FepE/Etk N-terminal domain-containing protein [Terracidiphilus sp.]